MKKHFSRILISFSCFAVVLASHTASAQAPNQPPVAGNDTIITQTTGRPITLSRLLENDSDPDNDPLVITTLIPGGNGTVTRTGDTTVVWTPKASFSGTDTFLYTVSDGRGATAQGTVNIRNPFLLAPGTYAGTAAGAIPAHKNAGYLVLTTTANGTFTGRVRIAGQSFSFKSVIGLDGKFEGNLINRWGTKKLTFQFPLIGKDEPITGQITSGAETSTFTLAKNLFTVTNPAPNNGYYTVKMPAPSDRWSEPQGIGYGTLRIAKNGAATINGKLGDGSPYSASTFMRADGTVPLYAGLYRARGSFFGSASFANGGAVTDVNGQASQRTLVSGGLDWFRPARLHPDFYPRGFTVDVALAGANYVAPLVNKPALALKLSNDGAATNAGFVASEDGLIQPANGRAYLGVKPAAGAYAADFTRARNPARVILRINPKTGTFNGSFVDRLRLVRRSFSGALLQGENSAAGVFKGGRYSGQVVLAAD
jgi:hypothetical protein